MRKEYGLTEEQYLKLLAASKPTPVMFLPGGKSMFPSTQENANAAWCELGEELGFDGMTVRPLSGKSGKSFTAETTEKGERVGHRTEK